MRVKKGIEPNVNCRDTWATGGWRESWAGGVYEVCQWGGIMVKLLGGGRYILVVAIMVGLLSYGTGGQNRWDGEERLLFT